MSSVLKKKQEKSIQGREKRAIPGERTGSVKAYYTVNSIITSSW